MRTRWVNNRQGKAFGYGSRYDLFKKVQNDVPGPGKYNHHTQFKAKKRRILHDFGRENKRPNSINPQSRCLFEKEQLHPAPGFYNPGKQRSTKQFKFSPHIPRSIFDSSKNTIPGPGHYEPKTARSHRNMNIPINCEERDLAKPIKHWPGPADHVSPAKPWKSWPHTALSKHKTWWCAYTTSIKAIKGVAYHNGGGILDQPEITIKETYEELLSKHPTRFMLERPKYRRKTYCK